LPQQSTAFSTGGVSCVDQIALSHASYKTDLTLGFIYPQTGTKRAVSS